MGRRLAAGQVPDGLWGRERGELVNRLGLEFEDEVAAAFTGGDFIVRRRVGIRDGQRNLGDVDVFVYDRANAMALLCECKRLERQITPQGFTWEREKLAGRNAASASRKQLDRAKWVKANIATVLGRLGIRGAPPAMRVIPVMVVREENLTRFAVRPIVPLLTLADLRRMVATAGSRTSLQPPYPEAQPGRITGEAAGKRNSKNLGIRLLGFTAVRRLNKEARTGASRDAHPHR
ncbi:MAG TPA: hypothetical protein VM327_03180 [Candidatus Thermoplasmatota archaeon]|nr:hypothetical protein [Candidatus Thermoplasmatota archaeon]